MLVVMVPVVAASNEEILIEISLQEKISLLVFVGCLQLELGHFGEIVVEVVASVNVVVDLEVDALSDKLLAVVGPSESYLWGKG